MEEHNWWNQSVLLCSFLSTNISSNGNACCMTEHIHDELHLKTSGIHQIPFINSAALCFEHIWNISGTVKWFSSMCSDKK